MDIHAFCSQVMHTSPSPPQFLAAERLALAVIISAALHSLLLLGINYHTGSGRPVAPDLPGAAPLQVRLDRLLAPPDDTFRVMESDSSPPSAFSPAASLPLRQVAATQSAPGASQLHSESYFRAGDLDVRPQIRDRVMPVYPETAGNLAGKVIVNVFISASGTVDEVAVVQSGPPGIFDESAISAFGAARFTPGMKGQRAVKSLLVLEVNYDSADRQNAQPSAR